jgi:hypothetical protein
MRPKPTPRRRPSEAGACLPRCAGPRPPICAGSSSACGTGARCSPRWLPASRSFRAASPSTELLQHFDDARVWSQRLHAIAQVRLELREFRHRTFGANTLPAAAWIDSVADAAALLGKQRECRAFSGLVEETTRRQPELLRWVGQRPLRALELVAVWPRLLDVVGWMRDHPRPGIYLRQIDLPGVHSKFVEAHRGVLAELLDLTMPAAATDPTATGIAQFCRRYGFLGKPERIRFRSLDPTSRLLGGLGPADVTLDAEGFGRLGGVAQQVFITENETNFLAFPPMTDALVIFGAGYGFEALERARWLGDCRLHYWGDIDTHGFAILDELRCRFGHVESLLMDQHTLMAFEPLWGVEDNPTCRDLPRLSAGEQVLYDVLRDHRIRPKLRLEQERIGYQWVLRALAKLA